MKELDNNFPSFNINGIKKDLLLDNMQLGFAEHEMIYDDSGKPIDYRYLYVNEAFEKVTGWTKDMIIGKLSSEVYDNNHSNRVLKYNSIFEENEKLEFENYFPKNDQWYQIIAYRSGEKEFVSIFNDITNLKKLNLALNQKNIEIIKLLATASEINDPYTFHHAEVVCEIAIMIAQELHIDNLDEITICAQLHDVGKIFMQHNILNKVGPLSKSEYETVKEHPKTGAKLLSGIKGFEKVSEAVLHHHEKFDGTGYPDGLKGDEIPIYSRIVTVADVYDALTSDRVYRKALTNDKALEIMENGRYEFFDPSILDVFFKLVNSEKIR